MLDDSSMDPSDLAWLKAAQAIDYYTCSNTRRYWEGEPPEYLRAETPEERECPSGTIICHCLATGEPCLFGYDDGAGDAQHGTPEG